MYLDFYGFRKPPFHVTPDPDFLFLSPGHREALASIVYGVEQRKGFIVLVGEVGVGKTTVLRSYLEEADSRRLKAISLFNPRVSFEDLLRIIHRELGSDPGPGGAAEMVDRLQHALIDEYRRGRNVALFVDEAQAMPVETLEGLRLLSNLETSTDKLVQIVLVGQPELDQMLGRPDLRQLRQRIAVRAVILPLSRSESIAYTRHRLSRAAREDASVFTRSALGLIVRRAGGIPRIVNILCDSALITAFGYRRRRVDRRVVREILADYDGRTGRLRFRRGLAVAGLAAAAAAAIWTAVPGSLDTDGTREVAGTARISGGFVPAGSVVTARPVPRETPAERSGHPAIGDAAPDTGNPEPMGSGPSGEEDRDIEASVRNPEPGRKEADIFASRVVRRGDSLSQLIVDVYGTYDPGALQRVMRDNPAIRDPDLIREGMRIVFPNRSEASATMSETRIGGHP